MWLGERQRSVDLRIRMTWCQDFGPLQADYIPPWLVQELANTLPSIVTASDDFITVIAGRCQYVIEQFRQLVVN